MGEAITRHSLRPLRLSKEAGFLQLRARTRRGSAWTRLHNSQLCRVGSVCLTALL